MKIYIVSVGTRMPAWVQEAYSEYARRLPKEFAPHLIELPLSNRAKKASISLAKKNEAASILAAVNKLTGSCHVVALDVLGQALNTDVMAAKIQGSQEEGKNLCLIIGGPDGLTQDCIQRANEVWSLSALTLPHPLVRVVLIEQLYRAWTILQNHPYHK